MFTFCKGKLCDTRGNGLFYIPVAKSNHVHLRNQREGYHLGMVKYFFPIGFHAGQRIFVLMVPYTVLCMCVRLQYDTNM